MLSIFFSMALAHADSAVYQGSSFNEVRSVIMGDQFVPSRENEKREWTVYQTNNLPQYQVNSETLFKAAIPLEVDAKRTVDEKFDYYDRLEKKLHSNGVCLMGEWQINYPSKYSGYFKNGSNGLFVGRVSTTMEHTKAGEKRGYGFAGKVFPTMDPDQVVKTANFFTVDVLMGTYSNFLDTNLTNEPETGFDLSVIWLGLKIASALKTADENPSFRPMTPISKLNEQDKIVTPHWMRITPYKTTIKNDKKDFRYEVIKALRDNKKLLFKIEVSDTTKDRSERSGWNQVGTITATEAVVSYGCDRRLHFAHPKLAD